MKIQELKEEWKKVIISNREYFISDLGDFKNRSNKILKSHINSRGYKRVILLINGIRVIKLVHVLVAESFLGKCPKNKEVNHKDVNKLNNGIENLEYVTHKENVLHAILNNRMGHHKLEKQEVINIRKDYKNGINKKSLSKKYKTCVDNIELIVSNKTWKHVL